MDTKELKYRITAFIDGELTVESEIAEIKKLIDSDPEFKREYDILRFTKSLVQNKCVLRPSPEKLKRRINRKIRPAENFLQKPLRFIRDIYYEPAYAFTGAATVVIIAVLLLLNQNRMSDLDLAAEQSGTENMFIQASSNFNSILAGKLAPQLVTEDAEKIKSFFAASGVKYATQIPDCKNWKILGAVVSEAAGEKFAHHVYSNDEGRLVYLFQVDESYLNKSEAIKLSDNMIKYLDEGKCYFSANNGQTILMKKMDDNICAIVSNAPKTEIENLFCSL